jgi:hypothetical protein
LKDGWDKNLPAIKDEHGVVLVGHRRLKIAKEDGIEPVIKVVTFGSGPEAEAARIRLANVSNIGAAGMTKEDRQRQAERLYDGGKGLSQTAIARMLGVTQTTIARDLLTLCNAHNVKDRSADTLGRKKTTGRPRVKGQTVPDTKVAAVAEAIRPHVKDGESINQVDWSVKLGVGTNTVGRAVLAERARLDAVSTITRDMLSMSAQQKLDAAMRQYQKALDATFHDKVNARVKEFLEATILPIHRKEQSEAKRIMNARKGVMDKPTFKLIWSALHPDSRNSISDKKLAEAFDKFSTMEKLLLDEKNSPTEFQTIPTNWDELKRRASEKRKAARRSTSGKEVRPQ